MEEGSSSSSKDFRYYNKQVERKEPKEHTEQQSKKPTKQHNNVGLKMLMKMGYKPGEGLGAKGQGIKEPIALEIMPKNAGIGTVINSASNSDITHNKHKRKKSVKKNKFSDHGSIGGVVDLPLSKPTEGDFQTNSYQTRLLDTDVDRLKILQKLEALQTNIMNQCKTKATTTTNSADKFLLEGQLKEYREYGEQVRLMQLEKKALLQVIREAKKRAQFKGVIDVKAAYSSVFPLIDDPTVKYAILLALLPKAAANHQDNDFYETLLWVKDELPMEFYQRLFDKLSFRRALHRDLSGRGVEVLLEWKPLLPPDVFASCVEALPPIQFQDWTTALEVTPFYLQLDCTAQLLKAYSHLSFIPLSLAKLLLEQWRSVDLRDLSDLLIQRYFFNHLARLAGQVVIDPTNQETQVLETLLDWRPLIGDRWFFLVLKDGGLFQRLRTVLYQWLSKCAATNCNSGYLEITEWYLAWKQFIFSSSAKDEFIGLLKIMEHFLNVKVGKELPKPLDVFLIP